MKKRTLATGIYEDTYGREVRWMDGRPRTKRFPLDAPLEDLKRFRERRLRQVTDHRRALGLGSFVRDVAQFLKGRKRLPSFKSDRAHLRPWAKRFGRASRFAITRDGVQGAVNDWERLGYSPREIRHRVRMLKQVFRSLDPGMSTPCDGIRLPKVIKRKARPVSASIVRDVALQLRKQELTGKLRDAKTRARFLVLALTGQRPIQVMRAQPSHLDWDRGLWYVNPAKGDEGSIVAFNDQIRAAWTLFTQAHAWGLYDGRSFAKTLHRNGWPRGVRPYQLRHTVGQTLKELGADLGDIQDHLGHASPVTTRQHYLGPSIAQLRATSAKLDGRVDPFALELPHVALPRSSTTRRSEQKGKVAKFTGKSAPRLVQQKDRMSGPDRTKTA